MAKLTINKVLQQAVDAHKAGESQQAHRLYAAILKVQPKHPDANHNTGLLTVGFGKIELALPFFKTALEANPHIAQFWQSYIDALIKLERLVDAKSVLDQAKKKGTMGDGFHQLEQRLNEANKEQTKTNNSGSDEYGDQSNALDTLKLDEALRLAKKKTNEGYIEEAKRIYQNILAKLPGNKKASDGLKRLSGGSISKASNVQDPPQNQQQLLINLYIQGQLQQALEQTKTLLQQFPSSSVLHNISGAIYVGLGQLDDAVKAYNKALAFKPDYAGAHYNMGIALQVQGKLEEAIEAYNKALAIKPDYADAYNNMGNVLKEQGKLDEAIGAYNKALAIKPDYADAYYNMGTALKEQGKLDEAIGAYNKALAIKPDYAVAYYNMGTALKEQGKLGEAIGAYNKALAIKPDYADAYNNMGNALKEQGKLDEAIASYNKALSIKPDYAVAYYNIGTTLKDQGKLDEAIASYNKALAIKTDYADAYYNMGTVLQEQSKPEEAIENYNKALAIKPDFENARTQKLYQQAHICNWDSIAEDVDLIPELGTSEKYVSPFALFSLEDAPDRHLNRSEIYAKAKYPQKILPQKARPSKRPKRIRIGYFSTDFKEHPVAYLIAKVLEQHNRDQFEVFGYSIYGDKKVKCDSGLKSRLIVLQMYKV